MERDPDNDWALRDGLVTNFVAEYNLLASWQFPDLTALHQALRIGWYVEQRDEHALVRQDADASDFLRDEKVRKILNDDELMEWIDSERYPMTLADGQVREVLNDESLMEKLHRVDWETLSEELELN